LQRKVVKHDATKLHSVT